MVTAMGTEHGGMLRLYNCSYITHGHEVTHCRLCRYMVIMCISICIYKPSWLFPSACL